MLKTGEMNAKNNNNNVVLIIKSKLVGDLFGSGFRASKLCESDMDCCEKNLYILKISLGRDAFALSGGGRNCHLQK